MFNIKGVLKDAINSAKNQVATQAQAALDSLKAQAPGLLQTGKDALVNAVASTPAGQQAQQTKVKQYLKKYGPVAALAVAVIVLFSYWWGRKGA